jgi:hypothetical protein
MDNPKPNIGQPVSRTLGFGLGVLNLTRLRVSTLNPTYI